jgi:orotidine-5'-phosphate decarboxylase
VKNIRAKDRLIVALDVSSHEEAIRLVDRLENVSFFKIGLQLFMAGDIIGFIQRLHLRRPETGGIFIDLKIGGDIRNTVTEFVRGCIRANVRFLTLVETVPLAITLDTVKTARAARGEAENPKLLMVPYLSSLDAADLRDGGIETDLNTYIIERAKVMLNAGAEGLIVSGDAIKLCRDTFGPALDLVSPGIRPDWATSNDHKRFTTPGQAIRLGADYLVVGRPITRAPRPEEAADRVIAEIDDTLQSLSAADSTRPVQMSWAPQPAHH